MSGMRSAQGMTGLIRGNAQGAADLRPTVAFGQGECVLPLRGKLAAAGSTDDKMTSSD